MKKKVVLRYLPIVGTIAMIVSYLPQLYLTYTTKNVEGQSLSFRILLVIGLISMVSVQYRWFRYSWGIIKYEGAKSKTGLVFQIINTFLASLMIIAILLFR